MVMRAAVHRAPRVPRMRFVNRHLPSPLCRPLRQAVHHAPTFSVGRSFASSRSADEVMEDLQELLGVVILIRRLMANVTQICYR